MTVKVIDMVPDPSVAKKVVCRNCGVTLEYVPADRKTGVSCSYDGSKDHYKYIDCPNCANEITVS